MTVICATSSCSRTKKHFSFAAGFLGIGLVRDVMALKDAAGSMAGDFHNHSSGNPRTGEDSGLQSGANHGTANLEPQLADTLDPNFLENPVSASNRAQIDTRWFFRPSELIEI